MIDCKIGKNTHGVISLGNLIDQERWTFLINTSKGKNWTWITFVKWGEHVVGTNSSGSQDVI